MTGGGNGGTDTAPAELVEFRAEQYEQVKAVFEAAASGSSDAVVRDRVRAEFPGREEDLRAAVAAFRDLLRIEQRPERFRRALRAWSAKVAAAIRAGDFASAGVWMQAVTENPVFPGEYALHVTDALKDLSRPELLNDLVAALAKAGDPSSARRLLAAWGELLVDYLIAGMVADQPPVNRRHLVEYLSMAGRNDVRLLTPWLRDPRWFIVRNVATAVGRAGRRSGIPALLAIADHADDRVRVEAVRALSLLEGDDAVGLLVASLDDPSQRMRNAALSLLRALPSDDVVVEIAEYLSKGSASADDARRLVKILAERKTEAAEQALTTLAELKSRGSKVAREAARATLARRS